MECHIHEALPIETQSRHPQRLSVAGSVLLDIVRFCAALVVAMGHFSEGPYAVRWPHLIRFAIDAVAIFFVLSGFVIRLITTISPVDARVYAVDRISRIYSVALPAVLFTFSVVLTLHILVPARSLELATYSIKTIWLQLLANVTLLTQLWGMDITANFNSVFWSLCYECAYYAFYGIAFFGRGSSRNWALFLLGLFVGPPILFLLPLWLFGCVIHDVYQWLRQSRHASAYLAAGLVSIAIAGAVAKLVSHPAIVWLERIFAKAGVISLYRVAKAHNVHLLQRASFRAYLVGVPAGLLMLCLLLLVDRIRIDPGHRAAKVIRRIADGTYSLYLFHIPLFVLAAAYVSYNHESLPQTIAVFLVCVTIAVLIESPLNVLKRKMRGWMSEFPQASLGSRVVR